MCRLNPCQILPLKVSYLSVYFLLEIFQAIHLLLYDNKPVSLYSLENKIKFQFCLLCNNITKTINVNVIFQSENVYACLSDEHEPKDYSRKEFQ